MCTILVQSHCCCSADTSFPPEQRIGDTACTSLTPLGLLLVRVVCNFFLLGDKIFVTWVLGWGKHRPMVREGQSCLLNFDVSLKPFVFRKGLEGPRGHGHGIDGKMFNTSHPFSPTSRFSESKSCPGTSSSVFPIPGHPGLPPAGCIVPSVTQDIVEMFSIERHVPNSVLT